MRVGRFIFASIFIVGGILHFTIPEPFIRVIPPILPWPRMLVFVSGGAELVGGIALLVPRLRHAAGYGLALLLVAVFPANIYMAVAHTSLSGWIGNPWVQWLRLPLQLPLIWWALYYTRNPGSD